MKSSSAVVFSSFDIIHLNGSCFEAAPALRLVSSARHGKCDDSDSLHGKEEEACNRATD